MYFISTNIQATQDNFGQSCPPFLEGSQTTLKVTKFHANEYKDAMLECHSQASREHIHRLKNSMK